MTSQKFRCSNEVFTDMNNMKHKRATQTNFKTKDSRKMQHNVNSNRLTNMFTYINNLKNNLFKYLNLKNIQRVIEQRMT